MVAAIAIGETVERYARYVDEAQEDTDLHGEDLAVIAQSHYERDYDRPLYSSGFRRLGGITQVVTLGENTTFHNRLTHSLKVAQTAGLVAGTIGRAAYKRGDTAVAVSKFGGLNSTVLSAACLAHDIGHPPFGHIGEDAIRDVLRNPSRYIARYRTPAKAVQGGFEGNAQSFRIVTRLAFREATTHHLNPALNLTRASLSAQSKYPWDSRDSRATTKRKWGAYASESPILEWAMRGISEREINFHGTRVLEQRTVEAQIMDWADDVAYAVHDVEDFFRAGLVPLDRLREALRARNVGADHLRVRGEFDKFIDYATERVADKLPVGSTVNSVKDLFQEKVLRLLPESPFIGSIRDRTALHAFASEIIHLATRNLELTDQGVLVPHREIYTIIEVLKQLTWYYVIDRPSLSSAQRGQRNVLTGLISLLWEWAYDHYQKQASETGTDENARTSVELENAYKELPPRLVDYIRIAILPELNAEGVNSPEMILRGVIDYVSSLTDAQALALHSRLSGSGEQSMLESLLFL